MTFSSFPHRYLNIVRDCVANDFYASRDVHHGFAYPTLKGHVIERSAFELGSEW